MLDLHSLSSQVATRAPLAGSVSKHFSGRPRLLDVANDILNHQLQTVYPVLTLDLTRLYLMTPAKQAGQFSGYHRALLTDVLMQRYLGAENISLVSGYHFLTHEAGAENPVALDVQLPKVQRIINEWGPQLMSAYSQALCRYWDEVQPKGGNRWKWLAVWLQTRLKRCVERDQRSGQLDAQQAATAMLLVAMPDAQHRRQYSGDTVHASLISLKSGTLAGGAGVAAQMTHALIIQRHLSAEKRDLVLLYTPFNGLKAYPSLGHLTEAFGEELAAQEQIRAMALYEPLENIFEVQAQAILEQQLAAVGMVGAHCRAERGTALELQQQVERVTCLFELDSAEETAKLQAIQAALPAWLLSAPTQDKRCFSVYLAELGILREQQGGKSFLEGIPDILTFARKALDDEIKRQHPEALATLQDDIEVHILTMPDAQMSIVDGGHRTLEDQQISLAELALDNLSGRPRGHLIIQARQGATLPLWVDKAAIEALVTQVDASGAYIRLLKQTLKDDPGESTSRQAIFTSQLARQLPMLALENTLRQLHGFTAVGCTYVSAVLDSPQQASVDGVAVALQQLGFRAAPGRHADPVHSMYVIARLDGHGPCVLYRPLFAEPLMEFDSREALLQAIVQTGELQRSVLDWLDPAARATYALGGFQAPHIIRFGQGSDFAPLETPAPAALLLTAITEPVLAHLYRQSVEALITVAGRQSLSSSDSRWISYKALAWTLFNALLPVFSGPLASAGWMVQAMNELGIALKAQAAGDREAVGDVIAGLFFNVALVLLTHGVPRSPWINAYPKVLQPGVKPQANAVQAPMPLAVEQIGTHLNFSWSRATRRLSAEDTARLAKYALPAPPAALQPVPHGALEGLYQQGEQWLVNLDGQFFQVSLADEQPRIIDPTQPDAPGPWLERDEVHRWRLDLRLRLRGGGPTHRIAQKRLANQARRVECGRLIEVYNNQRTEVNVKVNVLIRKINKAGSVADAALESTLREQLSTEIDGYLQLLRTTLAASLELNTLDPAADRGKEQAGLLGVLVQVGNEALVNLRVRSHVINQEVQPLQAMLQARGLDTQQTGQLFGFVQRSTTVLDNQVQLTKEVEGWKQQLERLPLEGQYVLKKLGSTSTADVPLQCWMGMLIDGLGLLCMQRISGQVAVCERFSWGVVDQVRLAAQSHGALQQSAEFSLNDRVEVLNSVDLQLAAVLESLDYFRGLVGIDWDAASMGRLQELVVELRGLAQADLVPLVREQLKMTRKQRSQERHGSIFVTARRGVLVGKRRPPAASGEGETFEVIDPIEKKVLASFAKNLTAGDWQEVLPSPAAAPVKSLKSLVNKGEALLRGADKEVIEAWRQSVKAYLPAEVEELLLAYARQLDAAADGVERQLTLSNETDRALPGHQSADVKAKAWRDKADQLTEEGRLVRIAMSKRQAPTVQRVNYLVGQKAVRIRKVGERKALKKGRDFMQEYEIADLDGKPLWYAHFHYGQARGAASTYERAHLKTAAQRLDGAHLQMAQEAAGEEVIGILRSRIDPPLDRLFLDVE